MTVTYSPLARGAFEVLSGKTGRLIGTVRPGKTRWTGTHEETGRRVSGTDRLDVTLQLLRIVRLADPLSRLR